MPIEFTRQSRDGRITLIIDPGAKPVCTLWALMISEDINNCIASLRDREGTITRNIHHVSRLEPTENAVKTTIKRWLEMKDLDAAIWTGLSYREAGVRPTIGEVIAHLKSLNHVAGIAAEEYIRRAPKQIDTKYRRAIESQIGWTAID